MMKKIPVLDLMFFLTEKKNNAKHVSALMLFELPQNAPQRFIAELVAAYRRAKPVPPFNYVPQFPLIGMPRWVKAEKLDMKYHVQHVALPQGASRDAFLEFVAELHTHVLDRHHPCFRVYFIEGLPERSFAVFLKVHHAMVDGQSAIARIGASLDERPDAGKVRPFFTIGSAGTRKRATQERRNALAALKSIAIKQTLALKDLYASLLRKGIGRGAGGPGSLPFTAPRGPTNAPMEAARTIATLSLPIEEMKAVGKAFGGTLNDVAVTIVDAALNRYLQGLGTPPSKPLVAMCPLSLREAGDTEAATKVSALFVPLGKRNAAIGRRMQQVMAAIGSAKNELRGMSKDAAMLYAILAFGLSEAAGATRADAVTRPLANFVLSNVPGPRTDLYLRGAKMLGIYPISALGGGMGLNATLLSYSNSMDFGFVANGASMPDLDDLARYTRDAFEELRKEAAKRAVVPGLGASATASKKPLQRVRGSSTALSRRRIYERPRARTH